MQIAICDDSSFDRFLLSELLTHYCTSKGLQHTLSQFDSGKALLLDVEEGAQFDVVFLDIYMAGPLGIEVARNLRALGYEGEIVFCTASSKYAVESYDVLACGYLLKPHSYHSLRRVMDRILKRYGNSCYSFRTRARIVRLPYDQIAYVESRNTKCIFHCGNGEELTTYKQLSEVESALADPRFLRCHRSYLVNMDYIRQADSAFLLHTGDTVLIRQRDLKVIRNRYFQYMAENKAP